MDCLVKRDLGSAVVTPHGQLAGVLISADMGSGYSHKRAYILIDFIQPIVAISLKSAKNDNGRHDNNIGP